MAICLRFCIALSCILACFTQIQGQKLGIATPENCDCVDASECFNNIIPNAGSCAPGLVCCEKSRPIPPPIPPPIPAPDNNCGSADPGSFPWIAALQCFGTNKVFGAGALVSSQYVLTAAHKVCSYVYNPRGLVVTLGQPNNPIQVNVEYVILHPSYNALTYENDLALIKLVSSVDNYNYNINKACLPDDQPTAGQRCNVAGWGINPYGQNGNYHPKLRNVDVPIVDSQVCQNNLENNIALRSTFRLNPFSFMCAGGEHQKGACEGDGGAPLMCQRSTGQWDVVGIFALTFGCGQVGVPGIYVNVANYASWIRQVTGTPFVVPVPHQAPFEPHIANQHHWETKLPNSMF